MNAFSTVAQVFINTVLPIFVVMGVGFFAQKKLKLALSTIARLGLFILSPALAFTSLTKSRLTPGDAFGLITCMLVVTIVLLIIGSITAKVMGLNTRQDSAFQLSVLFTNAGNYGIPLMELAFGREARDLAVIGLVTQVVLFNTLALWLATRGKLGWKQGFIQVLKMPVIYAVLSAIFFIVTGWSVPEPLDIGISFMAEAALPVILLSLGFQLAETRPNLHDAWRIAIGTVYRLALSPALTLVVIWLLMPVFNMSALAAKVIIVAMAMPTAVSIVLIAIEFEADAEYVSAVVFFSTLASAVTLTLVLTLLI
jgi:malate permease and related proteins